MALSNNGRMWSCYKRLYSAVDSALNRPESNTFQELETELKNYKPDFISLLQNQAKNAAHRDAVSKANVNGLPVQGLPAQSTQILTPEFIAEALVISDLFELNEIDAVDLLIAGESQLPYFPGLTRGLVAVLLYYDGKASLVGALRLLLQARQGRCYQLQDIPTDVVTLANRFTDSVMSENLPAKIIGLLKSFDPVGQLERLQRPEFRALGSSKHRYQVTEKLKEIEQCLADCLFYWACQCGMSRADTLMLIGWLSHNLSTQADGTLTDVSLTLVMSLLYCFDIKILDQQGAEPVIDRLPIVSDQQYIRDVHKEMVGGTVWSCPGVKAVAQFSWAQALYGLAQYNAARGYGDLCDQSETILTEAINNDFFLFLRTAIISSQRFHSEEFYLRKIHDLITDFLVNMPLIVKELRNQGDEIARLMIARQQEGLDADDRLPRDYEHLLLTIADLYGKDPLGLELSLEYWSSSDHIPAGSTGFSLSYNQNAPHRQISLFKFVRLAGDLLLQPLYVPYIKMLIGLSNGRKSAHQCFNLLSMNGGSSSSTVSWEHFYVTLHRYYMNLREEIPDPQDQGSMAHRHHPRAISQSEVDGLITVLQLICRVVELDESARLSMSENQMWMSQKTLLGLVMCNVPARLKAQLLKCLAGLCRTHEIAAAFWNLLDESQILPTISYNGSMGQRPSGIIIDLEEVESRSEEYPITIAFISLLNALTDRPVPAGLGAGYRVPGFKPYIDYLIESVFLKFNSRAYRHQEEKWEICSSVLEVLYRLLQRHEVSAEDFIDRQYSMVRGVGGGVGTGGTKPPGHILLLHMMSESSDLLRMILYIIDEASRQFDKYTQFAGRAEMERASLYCLMMIENAMSKQDQFLSTLRQSGDSLIGYRVDRILLSINPRSGRSDHLINIAKYVTYNSLLVKHSHYALRILINACSAAEVQSKIVSLFTTNEGLSQQLLLGFTECLEFDDAEILEDTEAARDMDIDQTLLELRNATRMDIIRLLLTAVDQPAPNLAHFLLGYNLNKPISKTVLQDPGVLGSPRTCLHSLVTTLSHGVDHRSGPSCVHRSPKFADLAYRLIHVLCADRNTSAPTLRYLRQHDFLVKQVQHLPFKPLLSAGNNEYCLEPQSWLLKSLIIEMRLCALNKQRSHVQRLLHLLIDDELTFTQSTASLGSDGMQEADYSVYDTEYSLYGASQAKMRKTSADTRSCSRLMKILKSVDFNIDTPSELETEFCSRAFIEEQIKAHEAVDELGRALYDVQSIHHQLMYLCSTTSPENLTGPKALIIEEIERICENVMERNRYRGSVYMRRHSFDSWRQAVEIILTACPRELLSAESRRALLFELLQDLLDKISKEEILTELSAPVAGVILTLTSNLSRCFTPTDFLPLSNLDPLSFLDSTAAGFSSSMTAGYSSTSLRDVALIGVSGSEGTGLGAMFAAPLGVVLRGLLEHILRCSTSSQRVRAYLYGSLLYYLRIVQKPKRLNTDITADTSLAGGGGGGVRLIEDESDYERMAHDSLDTLYRYGDNLIDIICHDACDGHDVGRMLSLACIDSIVSMDTVEQRWTSHMVSRGYLQHIIDTLSHDNDQLQSMLAPNPQPLRALYIFHSKICMLTRISSTQQGARAVLSCSIMSRLAEFSVFDYRPEFDRRFEGFIPSVLTRYRQQILFPVLHLCLSLLTSFGPDSSTAATEVLRFIVSHIDVFLTILRDRQTSHSVESVEELELATAVISRAAIDRAAEGLILSSASSVGAASVESRGLVHQLQRQMLALLTKYSLAEQLSARGAIRGSVTRGGEDTDDRRDAGRIETGVQRVLANVVTLCRNLVTKPGSTSKSFRILFNPSLIESLNQSVRGYDDTASSTAVLGATQQLNLGVLVCLLNNATTLFTKTLDTHKLLHRKYSNVTDLSVDEFKDLCSSLMVGTDDYSQYDKISAQRRGEIARRHISSSLSVKSQQLRLLSYMIECCMLLLWRHLDFYLIHCVPSDNKVSLLKLNERKQMRQLAVGNQTSSPHATGSPQVAAAVEGWGEELSVGGGVTRDQLSVLKKEVTQCISESLLKRLQDMEQEYTRRRTRYGFVTALLRRIRRLVQLHT